MPTYDAPIAVPFHTPVVIVPTPVMFVWLAVLNVPAIPVALTLPALIFPVTANEVNVPTLVILPCAAPLTVAA